MNLNNLPQTASALYGEPSTMWDYWNNICKDILNPISHPLLKMAELTTFDRAVLERRFDIKRGTPLFENIVTIPIPPSGLECGFLRKYDYIKTRPGMPVYLGITNLTLYTFWLYSFTFADCEDWLSLSKQKQDRFVKSFFRILSPQPFSFGMDLREKFLLEIGYYFLPDNWGLSSSTVFNQMLCIANLGSFFLLKLRSMFGLTTLG